MIQARGKPRKNGPNLSVQALRKEIGKTQSEFARLIGVSAHTVISWENGRNRLTKEKAWLIYSTTGARPEGLLAGKGKVWNQDRTPYHREDFEMWNATWLFKAPKETIVKYLQALAARHLWILFMAATSPAPGHPGKRVLALWCAFDQWLTDASANFRLENQIKQIYRNYPKELADMSDRIDSVFPPRKFKVETIHTGRWRRISTRPSV